MSRGVNQRELFSDDHTVYWPDRYEKVVEYLKNGVEAKAGPLSLYTLNVHVIVLAACVGLMAGEKSSLPDKDLGKEIPLSTFVNNDLAVYIYLIALLDDPDPDVGFMRDPGGEKRAIKLFEKYVGGGLRILNEKYEQGFVDAPLVFVRDLLKVDFSAGISAEGELPPEVEINLF